MNDNLTYEQFQTILKGDDRRFIEVQLDHNYDEYSLYYSEGHNVVEMAQKYPLVAENLFKLVVGCVLTVSADTIIIRSN